MSAYLQTSAAAQRAGTALKAGCNRLEDLQQIQCPGLLVLWRLTDTAGRAWKLLKPQGLPVALLPQYRPSVPVGNSRPSTEQH